MSRALLDFLTGLHAAGLKLDTIYDIGACVGNWSKMVKRALPRARFVLYEANPAYEQQLRATGFEYCLTCLSNPHRLYVQFYNGTNTGDSYYKETTRVYDDQESVLMECRTLDWTIKAWQLPPPDMIKLDTQGSELDILAGASKAIETASLIYTEVPIVNYNAGAPQIGDYLNFFRGQRFVPVRLLDAHYLENTLIQMDIMFMAEDAKNKFLGPNDIVRPFHDASLPDHSAFTVPA